MSHYRNQNSGDGSWSEFLGDVYSGVAVGIGHPVWFVEKTVGQAWGALASLVGAAPAQEEREGRQHEANNTDGHRDSSPTASGEDSGRGLRVVGVGYGRTGTYSLALALDELGLPTLHTQHLYENGEIFDHLVDNIFLKSIRQDEVIMGDPDFDLLRKGGFSATMDLPFALYFDRIMERYPDCKFILTVREDSEVWFRSWNMLAENISRPARYTSFIFSHVRKLEYYMRWLFSVVNGDKAFLSSPFPFPPQDRIKAIASYEAHNQRVRDGIPPEQLLEYSVRQGWGPLCDFLEIPEADCPSSNGIPFPRSNSARAVRWQTYSSFIGPLMLTVFILFSLFSLVFRKVTGMSVIEWCKVQRRNLLRLASSALERRGKRGRRAKAD